MPKSSARSKNRKTLLGEASEASETGDLRDTGHRGVNNLNDLGTREWLLTTKSVWYRSIDDLVRPQIEAFASALRAHLGDEQAEALLQQLLPSIIESRPGARDPLKAEHPATFAESDIEKLIKFFTKAGEPVLDPFLGSGTTLIACHRTGRAGTGIELTPQWVKLAKQRVAQVEHQGDLFPSAGSEIRQDIRQGDSRDVLKRFPEGHFAFVVTSPPYWSVLNKPADHKVKAERLDRGLATRYSDSGSDLGNIESYEDFLAQLGLIFAECFRVLQRGRYIAVVVSDFRDKSRFFLYHADVANVLQNVGFTISGITILVQDSKTLYPYGMPYAFVSNIHHQYVVVARRPAL